jgi:hypothetical protein
MLIDCILTACNDNPLYIEFIPLFVKAWKKLIPEADVKIVLISEDIPREYKKYTDYIILFKPLPGVSTSLTAQYIRSLYPSILPYDNGVIITDMDMIPMSREYYVDNIKNIDNAKFVYYRDVLLFTDNQIAMCYNVATPKVWSEIFNIKSLQDIQNRLVEISSNIKYTGVPGESGWFTDQVDLFKRVMSWHMKTSNFVYLKDKETGFKRLDRINFGYNPSITYTDYHGLRPYSQYKEINDRVVDNLKYHILD